MRQRGHIDDACARSSFLHQRHHQVGQKEVTQVVGPDLHLKTILGPGQRANHHAGVVNQDVNLLQGVAQLLRALPHTFQASKVTPENDN